MWVEEALMECFNREMDSLGRNYLLNLININELLYSTARYGLL